VLDLVKAFIASKVEAHLIIVGDGPLRNLLEQISSKYSRIHVLGYKPRIEALKLIKGSDLFILPSYHEGLSTALLEAMALHIPCIATAVGGNIELLGNGAGILVKPGDIKELAEKIELVISDSEIAKRISQKAYEKVLKRYTWDYTFRLYLNLYTNLVS